MAAPDGLLIVDKPAGWTSHDVVARCRRLAGTQKVGHAGTLDPMATGVLLVGIGRATRLLGYLALSSKGYDATIRLGQATLTDDAEGSILQTRDATHLTDRAVEEALRQFRGDIDQVPSSVSAVKIKGQRAYTRVREGETVELPTRHVRVDYLAAQRVQHIETFVDVDVVVECSTGTYVRALARDIGALLEVGGHLTSLRRTHVGGHHLREAHTIGQLAGVEPRDLPVLPLDVVARSHFAWCVVDESQVAAVSNGRQLHIQLHPPTDVRLHPPTDLAEAPSHRPETGEWDQPRPGGQVGWVTPAPADPEPNTGFDPGARGTGATGPVAVLAPGGRFLALYEQDGPVAKAVAVFAPA